MNETYPQVPGWKGVETSRQAAVAVKNAAANLREAVFDQFRLGSATADEIAERLETSILSVRPRVAELHKQGKLRDTGLRRKNQSGHNAVVWERNDERVQQAFKKGNQAELF